jgi:NAD(P)-dependent dehydrogenase (short-subunit alcohol dehydrogenase family)
MVRTFGRETTAATVAAAADLSGKTVVITGATGGLGEESAAVLAARGALVVMTGRTAEKSAEAVVRIIKRVPDACLHSVEMELSEPHSVRAAAARILKLAPRVDILINNAGSMAPPLSRNSLGWESQFAGNHMGHFILTALLSPAIVAARQARIVNLSSSGHQFSGVDFEDPHFNRRDYHPYVAYGQSKTANILFTVALAAKLKSRGVAAYAVMPGAVGTPLFKHVGGPKMLERADIFVKSIPQGAATQVWAATAPELAEVSGRYLEDCGLAQVNDDPNSVALFGYRSSAMNMETAERLWQLSESLAGQPFNIPVRLLE